MQYVPSTNTLFVLGTPKEISLLESLLHSIDGGKQEYVNLEQFSFFLYTPITMTRENFKHTIQDIAAHLKETVYNIPALKYLIDSARYIDSIGSFLFLGPNEAINELKDLITQVEKSALEEPMGAGLPLVYRIKQASEEQMRQSLKAFNEYLKSKGSSKALHHAIGTMKWIPATNSLLFMGDPAALRELQTLLEAFDVHPHYSQTYIEQTGLSHEFMMYAPRHRRGEFLKHAIHETATNLKASNYGDSAVLRTLESARWIPATSQLMLVGNADTLKRVQPILIELDTPSSGLQHDEPHPIQLQHINYKAFKNYLEELADSSPKGSILREMVKNMRYVKDSDMVIFYGPAATMEKIREVVHLIDTPANADQISTNTFSVPIQNVPYDVIHAALHEYARSFPSSSPIARMIKHMHWVPESNILVFTGTASDMQRIREIIEITDSKERAPFETRSSDSVQLQHVPYAYIEKTLQQYTRSLPEGDPLAYVIRYMHWVPETQTIIVSGTENALNKFKDLIQQMDTEKNARESVERLAVIRLEHTSGKWIMKEIHQSIKQMKKRDLGAEGVIRTLESAEWNPNSNTISITGTEQNIERARTIITSFDIPQEEQLASEIFIYSLQHITPQEMQKLLEGIAEYAAATDPTAAQKSFAHTIDTMRLIPDTQSIQFVGNPADIARIKELVHSLDNVSTVGSQIRETHGATFLVYKVRYLPPQTLLTDLRDLAKSIPSSDLSARSLLRSINSGRYVRESHSLIFTGPKVDLDKIHSFLQKIDTSDYSAQPSDRVAESYELYHPKYVPGLDLIQIVRSFVNQLTMSGVSRPELAETVDHLSYLNNTNTILVTGERQQIGKILELFEEFDTLTNAEGLQANDQPPIDIIGKQAFLNVALKNITGKALIDALHRIAVDVSDKQQPPILTSQELAAAIRSSQYIEPTNSIIATGDPAALQQLKSVIESLDRPEPQVFIEVLVIETNLADNLDFGVGWGSQGQVDERLAWGFGNFAPDANGQFPTNLSSISGTNPPTGQDIPFFQGGSFGVIGDIIWHKGRSYAALGPLLNALKTDTSSTIVLSQKIVAQNNRNARIFAGDNVPFTGSLVTTNGLTQTNNANLEYRNIGVTLSLTPLIGKDDVITMDIQEEISEEVSPGREEDAVTTNRVNGIRTTKTSMDTRASIPDQHFLVLSGTMRSTTTRTKTGIPCLGGLCLVGSAFSRVNKVVEKRNLIVFVKPQIIKTDQLYRKITRDQEEIYGNDTQAMVEDFAQGLEQVQAPEEDDIYCE